MPKINLLIQFSAGQLQSPRIYNNHKVAGVLIGRKDWAYVCRAKLWQFLWPFVQEFFLERRSHTIDVGSAHLPYSWHLLQSTQVQSNLRKMAGPTRLELATSGVTGRRSNQLNYDPDYSQPNLLVGGTGLEPVTPGL